MKHWILKSPNKKSEECLVSQWLLSCHKIKNTHHCNIIKALTLSHIWCNYRWGFICSWLSWTLLHTVCDYIHYIQFTIFCYTRLLVRTVTTSFLLLGSGFKTSNSRRSPSSPFLNCPHDSAIATPTAPPLYTLYNHYSTHENSSSGLHTLD
jgi:hypothetical protein